MEKYIYKQHSNTLAKVKSLAKKFIIFCKIEEYKDNPKKTWDVLRTLLPSKSILPAPNSVNVDGINISDPSLIAEKFNTNFANVGKLLASRLNSNDKNSFLTYIKSPCLSSVYLYPTSPQEIFTLINNLNLNKASGYDDISPFIL